MLAQSLQCRMLTEGVCQFVCQSPVPSTRAGIGSSELRYTACLGTTPYGCQGSLMQQATGSAHVFSDAALGCGGEFFLTVRATNCAGLTTTVASKGAKLCCFAPFGGVVLISDWYGTAVGVAGAGQNISVSWTGFVEPCSGLAEFRVELYRTGSGVVAWSSAAQRANQSMVWLGATLLRTLPSASYRVAVHATSRAGQTVRASAPLLLDWTPPVLGTPDIMCRECPRLPIRAAAYSFATLPSPPLSLPSASQPPSPPFCPPPPPSSPPPPRASPPPLCLPARTSRIELSWEAVDEESSVHSYTLQVDRDGTESWSDFDRVHTSAVRILAEELGYHNTVRFRVRACNAAGLCTTSKASRSVMRVTQPPSAGAVALGLTEGSSQRYMRRNDTLLVSWGGFVAAGCPSLCGSHDEACFYDPHCSDAKLAARTDGCNAGDVGQGCRFCGFGAYPACPNGEDNITSAAPDLLSESGLDLVTELCIGTTRYGCDATRVTQPADSAVNGSWSSSSLPLRYVATHLPNMAINLDIRVM